MGKEEGRESGKVRRDGGRGDDSKIGVKETRAHNDSKVTL